MGIVFCNSSHAFFAKMLGCITNIKGDFKLYKIKKIDFWLSVFQNNY